MIDQYDRKCKRLSEELGAECRALAGERERSSSLSSSVRTFEESSEKLEFANRSLLVEVARLKEEILERGRREEALLTQKTALETEVSQLVKSRNGLVDSERERVVYVMSSRFSPFIEKVRAYLSDRDSVRPKILAKSQLTGVVSCLERYIAEGIPIHAEKLAENKHALLMQMAALDDTVVYELDMADLP